MSLNKIVFDARVLTHRVYTGVENYTKNILFNIKNQLDIHIALPKIRNKYLIHLWVHFILPFKKGQIIFCPANIAPIFVPKDKKLILTLHDVSFLVYPETFSVFFRLYYNLLIPINIKRANKIITVSNFSRREILKHYPEAKNKIEVIYLGVDKRFKLINNINKKNQILYVGSLNRRKNFMNVIKAFELLNIKNIKLIVVGNFSNNFNIDIETQKLLKRAYKNKNIEFKKNIEDNELVKIYNESKLFIFPSLYEGFGLPILEAMACGVPVITSDISSLPEIGDSAVVYCDPYNIKDIKEKMEIVLKNKYLQKEIIKKGLKRVQDFDWKRSAQEHLKVFNKFI
jgi:glycosyltransferase involved in cell wall biosynthesis